MKKCFICKRTIEKKEEEEIIDVNGYIGVTVHKDCLENIYSCPGCERYTMDEDGIEYEGCYWSDCIEDRPEYDEDGNEIEYD